MNPVIYLFFKGNCLEAMNFYADTLGGEIAYVFRNGDAGPDMRMPGGEDMVMNMGMKLGQSMIMASDNSEDMYDRPQGFYVQLEPASPDEFERIFTALSKDAQNISMEPSETFWAERFTMFRDRFGTPWMLNFTGSKGQGNG